ncbi:MAG TPA: PrpF domain-containing protein, partial [Allocoleopsis sp.]
MEQLGIPATLMRGGTSKALFVQAKDLPTTELEQLDKWIRAVFGSPDRRQIDGVGGGDLLTSKLAIIAPSTRPDADIDYTFAQVGVDVPTIVRNLNCGNISAAVAPFVIDAGLVLATDPLTKVRIHNTNTGTIIYSEVPTRNGKACTQGELSISGVPGTGAEIRLDFRNTVGSGTGVLLPTGNVRDTLNVDGIGA